MESRRPRPSFWWPPARDLHAVVKALVARAGGFIGGHLVARLQAEGVEVSETRNIGWSELVSIDEVVSIVENVAGVRLERRYNATAPVGVRGHNSDNKLIRADLGWETNTPLRVGIIAVSVGARASGSASSRRSEPRRRHP